MAKLCLPPRFGAFQAELTFEGVWSVSRCPSPRVSPGCRYAIDARFAPGSNLCGTSRRPVESM